MMNIYILYTEIYLNRKSTSNMALYSFLILNILSDS